MFKLLLTFLTTLFTLVILALACQVKESEIDNLLDNLLLLLFVVAIVIALVGLWLN